jgi:polysaccharide export outer membrane protein
MSNKPVLPILMLILTGALPLSAQNVSPVSSITTSTGPVSGPVAHPLQVSTGDLLDVNVFDTPEFSAKLRVDEHGMVTLPLGGVLSVSGLTAEQVGAAIEARFRETDILKDPHVSVTVLEFATQGVTVLGEVKNPGVYPLLGGHEVLDLISAAGGLTTSAGRTVTVTHRDDAGHPVTVSLDTKLGNDAAFSVDIRPGDTVVVSHAGTIYVLGDVGKPGGFLIANNDRLTVLQAIALAQGTNHTASLNNTKLIRKTSNGHEELPIPLKKILADQVPDQLLADGDILFVPISGVKSTLVQVESILPSAAGAAVYHVP